MFSHRTDIAECMIRNEIKEWFKKLVIETCGPNVRYFSSKTHFNTYTYVEISGTKHRINEAVELIKNTSEIMTYKMPWLNGNTYYVCGKEMTEMIENKLKTINDTNYDFIYKCIEYVIIGIPIMIFSFRPDLDDTKKMEIDQVFKSLVNRVSIFITYPKIKAPSSQPSIYMTTNILTAFHGKFLSYLSLEDILSLEMANRGLEPCYDNTLDYDIQKFLRTRIPFLYEDGKIDYWNLGEFRINHVLRHLIHKYHQRLKTIEIPNLLNVDEIQSLSRLYNIEIVYHSIIHIDFKPYTNDVESNNFCAIYHFDPNNTYFLNYDPSYATQNYSLYFNVDDSFTPLNCSNEFSHFVLKSQTNCSPQKINAVLKYLTENFKASENASLMLHGFDLSPVSSQILRSLLNMIPQGELQFDTMDFNLLTMITILEQTGHRLVFRKCRILMKNVEAISNNSKIRYLWFTDMDIELNLFSILKNISRLAFINCRILNSSWEVPINMEISDNIVFSHSNIGVSTLLQLLNLLQCARRLTFLSCDLISCDQIERTYFTVQNVVQFGNMDFKLQTLFQILEYCEIQNQIIFDNCHFCYEHDESLKCTLRPVNILFDRIKFDTDALRTILETLSNESKVWIRDSCISSLSEYVASSNNLIRIEYIELYNCQFEIQILLNILGRMSRNTDVLINSCDVLPSTRVYPIISTTLSKLYFWNMKLNMSDLFAILAILKEKSSVSFNGCEIITADNGELSKIDVQSEIEIHFSNMIIESQITRPLLQTDTLISFNRCRLNFMTDILSNTSIQSHVLYRNMIFDLFTHLTLFANFNPNSKIEFLHCHFESTNHIVPSVLIKPSWIAFVRTTFDLDVLITIMERISDQTEVGFQGCDIQTTQVFSMRPIKIPIIHFKNMNLKLELILRIIKNCTNLSQLHFVNCKLSCSSSNVALPAINVKPKIVSFEYMDVDVQIFQIFMRKCAPRVVLGFVNCNVMSACKNILTNLTTETGRLVFHKVKYSSSLLQLFEHLNEQFIVEYHGQLTNRELIEICTKSPVYGDRLRLITNICTKKFYFELFADHFQSKVLKFELDTEVEYDLPTHLIPHFSSNSCDNQYDWKAFKIKCIRTNDASVKLEFLKNGKSVDLFYELNDYPDDSADCVVDYY